MHQVVLQWDKEGGQYENESYDAVDEDFDPYAPHAKKLPNPFAKYHQKPKKQFDPWKDDIEYDDIDPFPEY